MKNLSCVLLGLMMTASIYVTAAEKVIGGYWENWKGAINPGEGTTSDPAYYSNDTKSLNRVYYSFLTLAKTPNPDTPPKALWDGKAIYESMTQANVIEVMTKTDPDWKNPYNWQREKIAALIEAAHENNGKFIWAIGGWSDLTKTISDSQISSLVDNCIQLLKVAGDGIDFDWEHLSTDPAIKTQQRAVLGKIFVALRAAMNNAGFNDKTISYTTRFNAFWSDNSTPPIPEGITPFDSDGEGIDVYNAMTAEDSSFEKANVYVNIMYYDVAPSQIGGTDNKLTLDNYKQVLSYFEKYVPKELIVMGFEPGGQAAGGNWEGMDVDKSVIQHVQENGYGGVMFWAINQPVLSPSTENTGKNAQALAAFAKTTFSNSSKK